MAFRFIPERAAARFWRKVEKTDTCWLWRGARNAYGYGRLNYGGRHWLAHRLSLSLAGIAAPDEADVCHRCDNPACVRPDHLFVGSRADNMRDAKAKGRTAQKQGHGRRKLTECQVLDMRLLARTGLYSGRALAREFGVSFQQVSRILRGNNWSYAP